MAKRALAKPALAARRHVEHGHRRLYALRHHDTDATGLGSAAHHGVGGVDVEVGGAFHVARDDRTQAPVDVVEYIDQAGDVVKVGQGRFAILAGVDVDDVHCRAGGAEMDPLAGYIEAAGRIMPVKGEPTACLGEHVLDEARGKTQPAILVQPPARRRDQLDARRYRLGEPGMLEHVERGAMNAQDVVVAEWFEPAAD